MKKRCIPIQTEKRKDDDVFLPRGISFCTYVRTGMYVPDSSYLLYVHTNVRTYFHNVTLCVIPVQSVTGLPIPTYVCR